MPIGVPATNIPSLPDAKISFTQQNGTEIARIKCDTHTGAANMADLTLWTNYGGLYERMRITKSGPVIIHSGSNSAGNVGLTLELKDGSYKYHVLTINDPCLNSIIINNQYTQSTLILNT